MDYDVLIVGSGIGGMESALKLGDMGYRVLVVEKEPSVGGKMILLSKVFPTLDCASCISTPKMAATVHHPNVTVFTGSEVGEIARNRGGSFRATVHRKPRFVDEALCTGCRQCELACTVSVPDQFNGELVVTACGAHRVPAGGSPEGADRACRHVALHVCMPRGHQGPRLRLARAQRRVREGVRASCSRRHPSSGVSAAPATRPARPSAPGAASKGRCRSAG